MSSEDYGRAWGKTGSAKLEQMSVAVLNAQFELSSLATSVWEVQATHCGEESGSL